MIEFFGFVNNDVTYFYIFRKYLLTKSIIKVIILNCGVSYRKGVKI